MTILYCHLTLVLKGDTIINEKKARDHTKTDFL